MISKHALVALLKRCRIKERKRAEGLETGEYRSAFRGHGLEFAGVRPYAWGDDLRQMDWNVTARMGAPYVKELIEERELTLIAVMDRSPSMRFGTHKKLKLELAEETASLLAFLALAHRDRFGMVLYGNTKLFLSPPARGEKRIIASLDLMERDQTAQSSLEQALQLVTRVMKRRSHIFLISDFLDPLPKKALQRLSKQHEVFPFIISDPAEWELPGIGNVLLRDLETHRAALMNLKSEKLQNAYRQLRFSFYNDLEDTFVQMGAKPAFFSTDQAPVDSLKSFLRRQASQR